ncbi:iron-siderophore ABC transporter substrate-binding protein [Tenggerimyces flavus]|uniref:Iron-siderophore ABC transporter substrate-binding protein n=1 Tax=Tenggerimyces flavus TaxID=1708749 RepID=A0ABV7YNV0_9ACTN|nr:iron-siderophore ABC transporter substrate-binding protein [Tenggerimyces flavus]MBM7784945.1 iron complex transport system substrate-binding protein [Tenggerimyces flavus]
MAFATAFVLAAAGCSSGGGAEAEPGATTTGSETRTVKGTNGDVEVPTDPKKIVALWRPTMSALVQLGHRPVGAIGDPGTADHGWAPYLPDGDDPSTIQLISASSSPEDVNLEQLQKLDPDLIIGTATSNEEQQALLPKLSQIAPTVLVEWTGTGSWRNHLTDVAEVVGAEDTAQEIVADYDKRVNDVKTAVGDPGAIEVSVIRVQRDDELRFETVASFPGQILGDVGFKRPANQQQPAGDKDFLSVSPERLLDADAPVVFVLPNADNGQTAQKNAALNNPLWKNLQAVKANKAFTVDYAYWGASNYYGAYRILDDVKKSLAAS